MALSTIRKLIICTLGSIRIETQLFNSGKLNSSNLWTLFWQNHFIDEEKNNLLFERTEDFLKEHKDNLGRLYELKGIILGVVCDNLEVNESEINRLEESLKHYVDLSADHESSKNFIAEIDKIIEIGRIAENKKDKLVEILTTRIEKAQLETKIDQLRRKVKDRKNLGIDLISILDNEALITEIHRKAESELRRSFLSYSGSLSGIDVEIIVVSLVLIAILEYDSNYYENVRATYTELYRKYSEQKVEGKIRDILDIYRKPDTPGSRSRIINVALENAIVPQAYLPGFLNSSLIFTKKLWYNLPRESVNYMKILDYMKVSATISCQIVMMTLSTQPRKHIN